MQAKNNKISENFFKDAKGNRVTWQPANMPLYGWLIFKLFAWILPHGDFENATSQLSRAFLFTWAYLEATQGVNYFRKALGVLVLVVVVSFFVH